MTTIKQCLRRAIDLSSKLTVFSQLLSRLTLGLVFLETGWGKLTHLDKIIDFFTSLGIPAPQIQAPLVATVECIGGFFILVGLGTRFVSVLLIGVMAVAIITARREDLNELSDLFGMIEFLYIVLFVWLINFGAGVLSLDHLIKKKFKA